MIDLLQNAFSRPLPGREAQFKMAHVGRHILDVMPEELPANVRRSAILILFYQKGADWHVPLVRRTAGIVHSRQVGFPGGGVEPQDEGDFRRTAVREAQEEIGIHPEKVQVLGEMTPLYIPVSNNLVYPFAGVYSEVPNFEAQPEEVEHVIEMPLSLLLNDENAKITSLEIETGLVLPRVPYFDVYGNVVWGATAMMLSELKTMLTAE